MISSIKIAKAGPIDKQVELDFSYYSYINKKYWEDVNAGLNPTWLDPDCQTDRESRRSIIKGLMGMNGTGKTTIVSFLKLINSITQDYGSFFDRFLKYYDVEKKNNNDLIRHFKLDELGLCLVLHRIKDDSIIKEPNDSDVKYIINFLNSYAEWFIEHSTWFLNDGATLEIEDYYGDVTKIEKNKKDLIFKYKIDNNQSKPTSLYKLISKSQEDNVHDKISMQRTNKKDFADRSNKSMRLMMMDFYSRAITSEYKIVISTLKETIIKEVSEHLPFTNKFTVIDVVDRRLDLDTRMAFEDDYNDIATAKMIKIFNRFINAFGHRAATKVLNTIDPKITFLYDNTIDGQHDRDYLYYILLSTQKIISPTNLSSGTKQTIMMLTYIKEAFDSDEGKLVVIDELTNGIQYRIIETILKLFLDPEINKNKSQLLFTTHNIDFVANKIIDQKNYIILRRDSNGDIESITLYDFLLNNSEAGRAAVHPDRGMLSYMDHFNSIDGESDDTGNLDSSINEVRKEKSKYKKGVKNPFFVPEDKINLWRKIFKDKK